MCDEENADLTILFDAVEVTRWTVERTSAEIIVVINTPPEASRCPSPRQRGRAVHDNRPRQRHRIPRSHRKAQLGDKKLVPASASGLERRGRIWRDLREGKRCVVTTTRLAREGGPSRCIPPFCRGCGNLRAIRPGTPTRVWHPRPALHVAPEMTTPPDIPASEEVLHGEAPPAARTPAVYRTAVLATAGTGDAAKTRTAFRAAACC